MADVQFNPVFDETGNAQFDQTFTLEELPPSPPGVAGWVAYTGEIPALGFAASASFSLRGVQVWNKLPTKARVSRLWTATD